VTAIRLSAEMREAVDSWAVKQPDEPGRSEAIRRLVEIGLARKGVSVKASDLKATLRLLDAYAAKEKAGGRFKDNEQRVIDGYYTVRVANLQKALDAARSK
jgi:hypothetical protein